MSLDDDSEIPLSLGGCGTLWNCCISPTLSVHEVVSQRRDFVSLSYETESMRRKDEADGFSEDSWLGLSANLKSPSLRLRTEVYLEEPITQEGNAKSGSIVPRDDSQGEELAIDSSILEEQSNAIMGNTCGKALLKQSLDPIELLSPPSVPINEVFVSSKLPLGTGGSETPVNEAKSQLSYHYDSTNLVRVQDIASALLKDSVSPYTWILTGIDISQSSASTCDAASQDSSLYPTKSVNNSDACAQRSIQRSPSVYPLVNSAFDVKGRGQSCMFADDLNFSKHLHQFADCTLSFNSPFIESQIICADDPASCGFSSSLNIKAAGTTGTARISINGSPLPKPKESCLLLTGSTSYKNELSQLHLPFIERSCPTSQAILSAVNTGSEGSFGEFIGKTSESVDATWSSETGHVSPSVIPCTQFSSYVGDHELNSDFETSILLVGETQSTSHERTLQKSVCTVLCRDIICQHSIDCGISSLSPLNIRHKPVFRDSLSLSQSREMLSGTSNQLTAFDNENDSTSQKSVDDRLSKESFECKPSVMDAALSNGALSIKSPGRKPCLAKTPGNTSLRASVISNAEGSSRKYLTPIRSQESQKQVMQDKYSGKPYMPKVSPLSDQPRHMPSSPKMDLVQSTIGFKKTKALTPQSKNSLKASPGNCATLLNSVGGVPKSRYDQEGHVRSSIDESYLSSIYNSFSGCLGQNRSLPSVNLSKDFVWSRCKYQPWLYRVYYLPSAKTNGRKSTSRRQLLDILPLKSDMELLLSENSHIMLNRSCDEMQNHQCNYANSTSVRSVPKDQLFSVVLSKGVECFAKVKKNSTDVSKCADFGSEIYFETSTGAFGSCSDLKPQEIRQGKISTKTSLPFSWKRVTIQDILVPRNYECSFPISNLRVSVCIAPLPFASPVKGPVAPESLVIVTLRELAFDKILLTSNRAQHLDFENLV